jgi:hypothetical protein
MTTSEPGAAREFPAGRLSSFEDADDTPVHEASMLKGLLLPRMTPRSAPPAAPAVSGTPAPAVSGTPAAADPAVADPAGSDRQIPDGGGRSPDGGGDSRPGASSDAGHIGEGIRTTRPRRRPARPNTRPSRSPATVTGAMADAVTDEATPDPDRVRASNVHIPADFMPRLTKARSGRRLSNGEWVIAALEATHDRLGELIGAQPTGGSLFAPRATRAARSHDGPLTPFNVRLREADYAVIDELVAKFGAHSRGHLITVAFDAFLPNP